MTERRNTRRIRHWIGTLAVAAVAATVAAPAYAATVTSPEAVAAPRPAAVHPHGFEPGSVLTLGGCKVWLNTKKLHSRWYAQAVVKSWGPVCMMVLERSHNGGRYAIITWAHQVKNYGQSSTGYYYDDHGYKARACLFDKTWHCGKAI